MEQGQDAGAEGQAKPFALKDLELFMANAADAQKAFVAELPRGRYDIFLSHAAADATAVDALAAEMETLELKVYVDRLDDTLPDRSKVTRETAERLRTRMRACRMLVLAVTQHSVNSRWIPWELGFFDSAAGEIFVLPLAEAVREAGSGIEFLDLYTWLEPATAAKTLKTESERLRNVVHRQGEMQVTNEQARQIVEMGPQVLQHPQLALQWQAQILEATTKLQKAWWTMVMQQSWGWPQR
jgi:hypothetical protein